MMNKLFIKVCRNDEGFYCVDIKTFIVLNIFKISNTKELDLKIKVISKNSDCFIKISLENFHYEILNQSPSLADLCIWPLILLKQNHFISGLCSVCRQLCKLSNNKDIKDLLGFREACLVACAESSIWTRFCEIDLPQTINELFNDHYNNVECDHFIVPKTILKYENHLLQPVRIHNIYKIARDNINDQSLKSSTPREELKVPHNYAEGPEITLADLILYPCFDIIFTYFQLNNISIENVLPTIENWYRRVKNDHIRQIDYNLNFSRITRGDGELSLIISQVEKVSLYKLDPVRVPSVNHTKQNKIDSALVLVDRIKNDIHNEFLPFGFTKEFNWDSIPIEANPQGGSLPAKRAARKCEQLENVLKATLELVQDNKLRIVDFCSGSGHLGILVAIVLPQCEIILVENKEYSLARAKDTISKLNLTNITIVQSNLDYFIGNFDLGLALHACGLATDLVLKMCIKNKSHFICCPCCYGGIQECHEISYPRSKKFQETFQDNENFYFTLAHAADQTHGNDNAKTKQGYFCMNVIDTDRKIYAENCGYNVYLGKLQPETCTNKNNLLVGIYK